jgi:predicted Fe-Mo cluster-binding NifX family protein
MTRVAVPTWKGRVSPVFDVAEHLLLVDLDGGRERDRTVHHVSGGEPLQRAQVLTSRDVDVLVCGAISRTMEQVLTAAGVEVVPGIRGEVDAVLRAYAGRTLRRDPALHLPGRRRAIVTRRAHGRRCGGGARGA